MNINLDGKVALISGASRGIGRGIAFRMGRSGAKVVVNYRTHPDEAEEVAAEIRECGVRCARVWGRCLRPRCGGCDGRRCG